jgi:Protein of unknown function (DUF3833)
MVRTLLAAFAAALALLGCANVTPSDYRAERPILDLAQYFVGTVDGWGMVQDRSGKVLRRFHVVIEAHWDGDVGTLDETFDWSDGKQEKRVWTITRTDSGRYTGTAADVVGTAQGEAQGNALQWRYVLKLPEVQGGWHVDLDDWMYLVDEATMLNRSVITKFGIRFGDITIAFRKRR